MGIGTNFTLPPGSLERLSRDELRVFIVPLAADGARLGDWRSILSSDEINRASLLTIPAHRSRFIARRGMLRELIGHFLDCEPAEVLIDISPNGKPFLKDRELQFNISSSGELAAYAFALREPIGIDIASATDLPDLHSLAADWLHPNEQRQLVYLPRAEATAAFHMFWAAKESYLKSTGEGLRDAMGEIDANNLVGQVKPTPVNDAANPDCNTIWYPIPMPAPIHLIATGRPGLIVQTFDLQ